MSIEYTYEIVEVNRPAKCMLVKYTADGRSEHLIGTRMPCVGEPLESVIAEYAPIFAWIQETLEIADVEVGRRGVVNIEQPPEVGGVQNDSLVSEEEAVAANEAYQRGVIKEIVLEVLHEQSA